MGRDAYGFGMLPAGYRAWNGTNYVDLGRRALFWTSTPYSKNNAWYRHIYHSTTIGRANAAKGYGFNVRCVREGVVIIAPNNILQGTNTLALDVIPKLSNSAVYTWSAESASISNIESKVTFPTGNGTNAGHTLTANLSFTADDMNKNFTLALAVEDAGNVRVFKKDIEVGCYTTPTGIIGADSGICSGSNVTLSLEGAASQGGVNWVWRSGSAAGVEVGRGTSISVNPTKTTTYYVRAEGGSCGNGESLSKEVLVANIQQISSNVNMLVCQGNTAIDLSQYVIDPTGTAGLTPSYQWYANDPIAGATSKGYVTPENLAAEVWTFYKRVATLCGNKVESGVNGVYPYNPQNNADRYSDQSICSGQSAILSPGLAGVITNGEPAYQWQSSTNGTAWVNIDGATGLQYVTPNLTATTHYRRLIIQCGQTYTPARHSTVYVASISQAPTNYTVYICPSSSYKLTFADPENCGIGTPTYQWYMGTTTDVNTHTPITGATGKDYSTPTTLTAGAWTYFSRRATLNGTVVSGYYGVYPYSTTLLQNNIANRYVKQEIACGQSATLSPGVTATLANSAALTYSWEKSLDQTNWQTIAGATDANITDNPTVTTYYRRSVKVCGANYVQALSYPTIFVDVPEAPTVSGGGIGSTGSATLTAVTTAGNTVDWYTSETGTSPSVSGSLSYTATAPFTVYALARSTTNEGCVSPRVKATTGGTAMTFTYTGSAQEVTLPAGKYKIELWGASGGDGRQTNTLTYNRPGGKGGYTSGVVTLTSSRTLYVYVGGAGGPAPKDAGGTRGWNGGGLGGWDTDGAVNHADYKESGGGGGGATDVRLVGGAWNNAEGLRSRVMVAAGGGGSTLSTGVKYGAKAGGLVGGGYNPYTYGGTQTSGNAFGIGMDGFVEVTGTRNMGGGGGHGGGYYGGYYSTLTADCGGAGGSSFISGHAGCNAVNASGTHTGQANHYSGLVFASTVMIDGGGYAWTTSMGAQTVMPNPDGGSYATGVGHTGNGVIKITKQ